MMDYSTISNKTSITEVEELTNGELGERYYLLKKQYENLSSNFEATKQELHDTRRSYQTALDVQGHLTAELECHQTEESRKRNELNSRITTLQEEISALREEHTEAADKHAIEIKKFENEIRRLKEEQSVKELRSSPERDNSELEEAKNALVAALNDTAAAKAALEETRAEIMQWRLKTDELVTEIGELRAAAEIRREELKAASERESAALAELAETRVMLHQFDSPDLQPHAAKGNSIFAEVEDKRQEMAKTLLQMKQTNARLRRDLANKQTELDALLHEKQNIWELQTGAAAHYDAELLTSYEERITQLEDVCERQRQELARWFSKHSDPQTRQWLPAVLEHLRSEVEKLRGEVLSRGVTHLTMATQVRELRRKVAVLTANEAKKSISSPLANNLDTTNTKEAPVSRPIQIKMKPNPDDVRKKVSFN